MKEQTSEEGGKTLTKEVLIKVIKGVSLFDLSECTFEYDQDETEQWINALQAGRVIDSIVWDRNIFKMMNNDGSFAPLNPMLKGYELANVLPSTPSQDVDVDKAAEEAISLLKECEYALNHTYDATEWPADGSSNAEVVAKKINEFLKSFVGWEARPRQEGAVWVKATERLPGWNKEVKWRQLGKERGYETPKSMLGWASMFLKDLEWYDESESHLSSKEVQGDANYWKQRCEAAEAVADNNYRDPSYMNDKDKEAYNKWQTLKNKTYEPN